MFKEEQPKDLPEDIIYQGPKKDNLCEKEETSTEMGKIVSEVIYFVDDGKKKDQFQAEDEYEITLEEIAGKEKVLEDEVKALKAKILDKKAEITKKQVSKKRTLFPDERLHPSLRKAFLPGANRQCHRIIYCKMDQAFEDEEVDVLGENDDSDVEEVIGERPETIEIPDESSDDGTSLPVTNVANNSDKINTNGRDPLASSGYLTDESSSNSSDAGLTIVTEDEKLENVEDKETSSSKSNEEVSIKKEKLDEEDITSDAPSSHLQITDNNDVEMLDVSHEGADDHNDKIPRPVQTLSSNPQPSSNLEKKSIIIGGIVKKIIPSTGLENGVVKKPVISILSKNNLRTLGKSSPEMMGASILKALPGQVRPVRIVNASKSLLKPILPKPPSNSQPGAFIKISEIHSDSLRAVPSSQVSYPMALNGPTPPKIRLLTKSSLSPAQPHLLQSSQKAQLNSVLKTSPTSPKIVQQLSSPKGPALLKLSPLSLSKTSLNDLKTKYICCLCNLVFFKDEHYKVHQITKHPDQVKLSSPSKGDILNGKPVLVNFNGKRPQVQNVVVQKHLSKVDSEEQNLYDNALVTLADLLELERELGDNASNCGECQGGKSTVSELKSHSRIHHYGKENCEQCKHGVKLYKKFMSHLETHVPESDSDCEIIC